MKQNRRTDTDWRNLMIAYEQGDQTQREFCQTHELAWSTFQKWRHQLKGQIEANLHSSPIAFKQIVMTQSNHEKIAKTVVKERSWDVELELRGGMVLRIRGGVA